MKDISRPFSHTSIYILIIPMHLLHKTVIHSYLDSCPSLRVHLFPLSLFLLAAALSLPPPNTTTTTLKHNSQAHSPASRFQSCVYFRTEKCDGRVQPTVKDGRPPRGVCFGSLTRPTWMEPACNYN